MTRAKDRPTASIDLLVELAELRKLERLQKQHGRWDQSRREEHSRKIRLARHRKQMAKLNAKRQPKRPLLGSWSRLSLSEQVLLCMLPGEWLTSRDIADRMQLRLTHRIKPIVHQKLLRNRMIVKADLAEAAAKEHEIWRVLGVPMPRKVVSLTRFGCAARAATLDIAHAADMLPPYPLPESEAKIPEKFLDSFQIDFSPFLGGVGTAGSGAHRAARRAAAIATVAQAHGGADPFQPTEWGGD